jgi:hypothetical protein
MFVAHEETGYRTSRSFALIYPSIGVFRTL